MDPATHKLVWLRVASGSGVPVRGVDSTRIGPRSPASSGQELPHQGDDEATLAWSIHVLNTYGNQVVTHGDK